MKTTRMEGIFQNVVGQSDSRYQMPSDVRELASARKKPIGSFIFLGPTGGKTELLERLQNYVQRRIGNDPARHVRIHGETSVSKIIGSHQDMLAMKKVDNSLSVLTQTVCGSFIR